MQNGIRFGSVTPLRVRLMGPDGTRDVPPKGYYDERTYVHDMVEAFSKLDLAGDTYKQSPEHRDSLQQQLAQLDQDYRPGDEVLVGDDFMELSYRSQLQEPHEPKPHETFLLITGEKDKAAYRELLDAVDTARGSDPDGLTKAAEADIKLDQWVEKRVSEDNRKPIVLEGWSTWRPNIPTALLSRIYQLND